MRRSPRACRARVCELERRALLARLVLTPAPPVPPTPATDYVSFGGPGGSGVTTQAVSQQGGVAIVTLSRYNSNDNINHPLQVQVTTDASSPYVGVNVGAVNQIVTFAPGQLEAALTVPIIAGAANPGEVDVNLTMTPVDPSPSLAVSVQVPVDTLRILASDASIPPAIVATNGTPQGLQLVFNKPMDPAQASNVKNYAVSWQTIRTSEAPGFLAFFSGVRSSIASTPVPLKAAEYDAATNTVTLIPRRRFSYDPAFVVTQGPLPRAARGAKAGAAHGLVDLEGQPIDGTTTPGRFNVTVSKGLTTISPGP